MKNFIALCALVLAAIAQAQETGQFEIRKTSFKDLYNNYRYASPKVVPWSGSFFPYADKGTAVKLSKSGDKFTNGKSPMESYALLPGGTLEAYEWEKISHACDNYDEATKKSCRSWWGHCNGWAAAAIKEKEPRSSKVLSGNEYTVADQKGILSELWLSSYSMNAGLTDKSVKTGKWVHEHDRPSDAYKNFWDVTPKAFFLIFTNYVGVLKTGVVIDRFAGDEVWNQPIVGYRMLPIRSSDISEIRDQGRSYWSVKIRMKIYWGNDIGISPGHLSQPFDITKMSDNEDIERLPEDYEGRYLAFRLTFNSQVSVSSDGMRILSAGRMIGEGIWEHQEDSQRFSNDDLNHTHPDFIWLPTTAFQDSSGYGNPFIDSHVVQKLIDGKAKGPVAKDPVTLILGFAPRYFEGAATTAQSAKKKVQSILRRDGIKHVIYLRDIEISRNKVVVVVRFPQGIDQKELESLLMAAGMPVNIGR